MISNQVLKKQVDRLLRLPYTSRDPEDLRGLAEEYRRVLRGCCRNDEHCVAVVDAAIDTPRDRAISPADLVASSHTIRDPRSSAPAGCEACNGTGWVQSTRRVVTAAGEYEADYSALCTCALGSFIREGEREMLQRRRSA
jgi:hypothetical protein